MLGSQFRNPAFSYQKRRMMIQKLLGSLHSQGQQGQAGGIRGGVAAGGLSKMNQRPSLTPRITNPHAQGISKLLAQQLGAGGAGIPSPLEYSQDYGVGADDGGGIDYGTDWGLDGQAVDDYAEPTPATQNDPYGGNSYGGPYQNTDQIDYGNPQAQATPTGDPNLPYSTYEGSFTQPGNPGYVDNSAAGVSPMSVTDILRRYGAF